MIGRLVPFAVLAFVGVVAYAADPKPQPPFQTSDRCMRRIALQSAVGGMALSVAGMLIAFGGWLPPVAGAVFQEVIDLAAVLNALRAAVAGGDLSDY